MSEDFYAALMMRRALPTSTDIKSITAPGIYPVDAGNASAPDSASGILQVLPPSTSPKLKFIKENDWNEYSLVSGGWQGLGTAATATLTTSTTDSTPGHVLKVGDRGLGVIELPIIEGFDFKTYAFAGGETILINLTTAVNIPLDLLSPSGWVYIQVTGVRNVFNDVSIQVTDYQTGNITFFVSVSDSINPRNWYKGGLRVGGFAANAIQIENIDRATGNGLIAYYDTAGKLAFNMGYYQDMFSVNFYDETGAWVSNPFVIGRNGNATVSGNLSGGAVFDNGQRVYSPSNPPPATDLSAYVTSAAAYSTFLQGVRLGSPMQHDFNSGGGAIDSGGTCVVSFSLHGGSDNGGTSMTRYVQVNINGVWANVGVAS